MRRLLFLSYFMLLLWFTSCGSYQVKTIDGKWKQEFLSYQVEKTAVPPSQNNAIIEIKTENKQLNIVFDYDDGYSKDETDSIIFAYPKLTFRKINLNKSSNYYTLTYQERCDCFLGKMNSFSGNILNIKLTRYFQTK